MVLLLIQGIPDQIPHHNIKIGKPLIIKGFPIFMLSYQDSNLDKQNQNLLCYHYTIGQSQ